MRDPAFDETLLPVLPALGDRDVVCAFCRIVFERPLTGRPPRFCSKRCRQADNREVQGAGHGHGSSPRRRRLDCRTEAELELAHVETRAEALNAAVAAWPRDAFEVVYRRRMAEAQAAHEARLRDRPS